MIAKITMFAAALSLGSALAAKEPYFQSASEIAVPYGDLDLTTAHGRTVLNSRLQAAAKALCPVDPTDFPSVQFSLARKCIAKARAGVSQRVAQVTTAAEVAGKGSRQVAAR